MTATRHPTYRLTGAEFRRLGSGYGDESTLSTLRAAQLTKRLLLLRGVHDLAAGGPAWTGALDDAWAVLREITERWPDAARPVLGHPFVDTWASRSLRLLRAGEPADLGYLSCLAVAAASRAGYGVSLTAATPRGQFEVPTVGLAYGLGDGTATATCDGAGLVIEGPARTVRVGSPEFEDAPGWCARREVTVDSAGGPLTVAVEDLDGYRSCFGLPVSPRLDPAGVRRLAELLAGAWRLIVDEYPPYVGILRQCLGAVVPLVAPAAGSVSASAQTTFGAVALSPPDDAAGLALLLIHETQHMKLSAILDLVDLTRPDDEGLYHAPWRRDPRPASALLQGAYAHAGVTDFWRVRRSSGVARARQADFEFAYWLEQSRRAAGTLAGSGALTEHGEVFVGELIDRLDGWRRAESLAGWLSGGIDDLARAVSVRWRLEHHRPEPALVARLASAWRANAGCPPVDPPAVLPSPTGGPPVLEGRVATLRAWLADGTGPADDRRPAAASATPHENGRAGDPRVPEAAAKPDGAGTGGDSAGDFAAPDGPAAWTELALDLSGTAGWALAERPDLVRDLLAALSRDGAAPTPAALAGWLAGGLRR